MNKTEKAKRNIRLRLVGVYVMSLLLSIGMETVAAYPISYYICFGTQVSGSGIRLANVNEKTKTMNPESVFPITGFLAFSM